MRLFFFLDNLVKISTLIGDRTKRATSCASRWVRSAELCDPQRTVI